MTEDGLKHLQDRIEKLVRPELAAKQEALELVAFLYQEFPHHPRPLLFGNEYHSVEIEFEGITPETQPGRRATITIASDGGMFYERWGPDEHKNPHLYGQGVLSNLWDFHELVRWMEGQDVPRFS